MTPKESTTAKGYGWRHQELGERWSRVRGGAAMSGETLPSLLDVKQLGEVLGVTERQPKPSCAASPPSRSKGCGRPTSARRRRPLPRATHLREDWYRYDAPDNASGPATRERPGPGTGGESHAVPTLLVRVMASASITVRTTKTGRRFVVRYRLGGRAYPVEHGGSF